MSDTFTCSKCSKPLPYKDFHEAHRPDRERPVTSQCKHCRSQGYYAKKYPNIICIQCLFHKRKLDSNKICKECNEATGLRECTKCKEVLPALLSFHGARRVCKDCRGKQ